MDETIFIYLVIINFLAVIVFLLDKQKAKKKMNRTSEKTLHVLELAGGVFSVVPCMYIFRHKNKKASYYLVSYLILFLWIGFFVLLNF
jgi:uncharacterized membrane protein YsdA (DUF1294 family)